MPIHVTAIDTLQVGEPIVIEGPAPAGPYSAVFEDDAETGYFYALDTSRNDGPIEDALHIYNVANVSDRSLPSEVKIGWSQCHSKAVLLINGYPHAVFDFAAQRGYSRSGFPPPDPDSPWGRHPHDWDDAATELFA